LQGVFAFQRKLAASQWLTREALEERQLEFLKKLVGFAARDTPFWRDRRHNPRGRDTRRNRRIPLAPHGIRIPQGREDLR
jgi:phenylacetate-coenzyme A ligase PaaK-like adenylate-forming protein